jgi:hypothetical protein
MEEFSSIFVDAILLKLSPSMAFIRISEVHLGNRNLDSVVGIATGYGLDDRGV